LRESGEEKILEKRIPPATTFSSRDKNFHIRMISLSLRAGLPGKIFFRGERQAVKNKNALP
jgi:hypothetical protein